MRTILTLILTLTAGPALAHIGHLGELGGHDHWIALGGIAIAGAIALWGARKKPKEADVKEEDTDTEDESEEATA